MAETRPTVPLVSRWTLTALGTTGDRRLLRPRDATSAWLLRTHPALGPGVAAPDRYTTIRMCTELVDRGIVEEAERARADGVRLALWSVGGGFDARWVRLHQAVRDVVGSWHEEEEPFVLECKTRALEHSPFGGRWSQVKARAAAPASWTVKGGDEARAVVVLEGLVHRLGEHGLWNLLARIREGCPQAVAFVDLAELELEGHQRWSARRLREAGWNVAEDVEAEARQRLVSTGGLEISPGSRRLRLLRLYRR